MLNINTSANGSELTVTLEGRLDTTTAPSLETKLTQSLGGVSSLVFDMAALSYISSAGLRVLLSAQKTMNKQGDMVLRNVSDDVKEIFEVTGFTDILTIE
ncbi:MAG: STAS domain-containing protein [Clostridia bacterium]|nr:STAS domain-containing protein [Clostridia bacterium]